MNWRRKRERLYGRLRDLGRLLVAYSGGVDSAYLAWAAHEVLGEEMLAVMADSPSLARTQMRDAVSFAEECGIPLETVQTDEMENADYRRNDAMRCFHCKDALFGVMEQFAAANGAGRRWPMGSTWTIRGIGVRDRRRRGSMGWRLLCWRRD